LLPTLGIEKVIHTREVVDQKMRKINQSRDQLKNELRSAYEGGASIRTLVASTGRSYGSIHSLLRESGTTMRGRGGPNHRSHR
jgi:hypothetical protein